METVALEDCPTGLFLFGDCLGFMSEYATIKEEDGKTVGVQRDAYVVSSGEYFWGGVSDWRLRAKLQVTPIWADDKIETIAQWAYLPEPEEMEDA